MLPPLLEPYGLWLTLPLAAVALVLLVAAIRGLARATRAAELASSPLVPAAPLELAEGGDLSLWLEGPMFARAPSMKVSLRERSSGIVIEARRPLVRMRVNTLASSRREMFRLRVERPGSYELQVDSIAAATCDPRLRLVFTRAVAGGAIFARALAVGVCASAVVLLVMASAYLAAPRHLQTPDTTAEGGEAEEVATPAPPLAAAGGQPVLVSPAPDRGWQVIVWDALALQLRAPGGWGETAHDGNGLMLRDPQRRFYLGLQSTRFLAGVPLAQLTGGLAQSASMRLAAGAIDGFAERRMGPAIGVIEVPREGQIAATWRGFVERDGVPYSLDLLIGGGEPRDRAELRAIFAAVLDSIHFD